MDNININDLISSLSAEDMNMLKGVASSLIGEGDKTPPQKEEPKTNAISPLGLNADDFNMMMKAKTVFDRMNSASNKNTDLILALKPHLSPEHRDKADMAIKILKLFEILPLLRDLF